MHDRKEAVDARWATPVYVRIGHGASEVITGPQKALHFLMIRWPTERGAKYTMAGIACANSVEGRGSPEVAKEAFIAAAIEASVLA